MSCFVTVIFKFRLPKRRHRTPAIGAHDGAIRAIFEQFTRDFRAIKGLIRLRLAIA
jgi:hypothetical protein